MNTPGNRNLVNRPQTPSGLARAAAMSGAVDLSGLKAKAEAAKRPPAPENTSEFVFTVRESDFQSAVVERSKTTLVIVSVLSPSPQLAEFTALLEQLTVSAAGRFVLAKVDVAESPQIVKLFGVQGVPTVIAVVNGQPISAFEGVQSSETVIDWLAQILEQLGSNFPSSGVPPAAEEVEEPIDVERVAAEDLLASGDLAGALVAFEKLWAERPADEELKALVKNLRFISRARQHELTVVESAGDLDHELAAADVLMLNRQNEEAFDRLIAAVKAHSGVDRNRVRTRILELFELFDPAEELIISARRQLASALY